MRFIPRRGPLRIVVFTTAVAVAAGAAGWAAASQVKSPADAAAQRRPPIASLITVPVEKRVITSTVVAQGSVTYGKAQPITLTGTAGGGTGGVGPQLVTKTSVAGRTLREGDVLLEVNGRPVFVLRGEVPMYRTLVRGSEGDDVRQLRAALRRLMPTRDLAASCGLTDSVLSAVSAWYGRRGYQAAVPTVEQRTQLRQLERAMSEATQAGGQPLADARADLAQFRMTYGTSIPSGEVLFLPQLPIRLTSVTAKVGAVLSGPVGTVADPYLVVNATVATEDAGLLKTGMAAILQDPAGGTYAATLTGRGQVYADTSATDGEETGHTAPVGTPIRLTPKNRTKITALAGQSVKVLIKVGSTGGEVLSVPVAAVFTAADGQARVTVASDSGNTRDVQVEPGLTANGNVQVTPRTGASLAAGERVVVSGS